LETSWFHQVTGISLKARDKNMTHYVGHMMSY